VCIRFIALTYANDRTQHVHEDNCGQGMAASKTVERERSRSCLEAMACGSCIVWRETKTRNGKLKMRTGVSIVNPFDFIQKILAPSCFNTRVTTLSPRCSHTDISTHIQLETPAILKYQLNFYMLNLIPFLGQHNPKPTPSILM
jgi:hypothetical protein